MPMASTIAATMNEAMIHSSVCLVIYPTKSSPLNEANLKS